MVGGSKPKGSGVQFREKTVTIKNAVDREQLLVNWLQELLYIFDAEKLIPCEFDILELSDCCLKAKVSSIPLDLKIHKLKHQIKAVTHHNLAVKRGAGQFDVTVIFDI